MALRRPHLFHHRRRSSQASKPQTRRSRRRKGRISSILFRIFYSTSFTAVFVLTLGFVCATPVDMLYQSYRRGRLIDMFLLAGAYFVTFLAIIFLYASRLYTTRSILKDIPKTFMPVEKGDLPRKRVWRLLEDCKSRSSVIAYQARPRARRIENELPAARQRIDTLLKPEHIRTYTVFEPQWGRINHRGWSGPEGCVSENPDLEYATVITQLLDLVEARAVSLVPGGPDDEPVPGVIEALARPLEAGMRQYIGILTSLGILEDNDLIPAFLTAYERARFGHEPISESDFRTLMRVFAELLRSMKAANVDALRPPEYTSNDDPDNKRSDKFHEPVPRADQDSPLNHKGKTISRIRRSRSSSSSASLATSTRRLELNELPFPTPDPPTDNFHGRRTTMGYPVPSPSSQASFPWLDPHEAGPYRTHPDPGMTLSGDHPHQTTMGYDLPPSSPTVSTMPTDDERDDSNVVHHQREFQSSPAPHSHHSDPSRAHSLYTARTAHSHSHSSIPDSDSTSIHDLDRVRTARSQASLASGRSRRSGQSQSETGSVVVRLTRPGEETELPYVIELPNRDDQGFLPR